MAIEGYGISNRHYAAVAVGSLLMGAALTATVRMSGTVEAGQTASASGLYADGQAVVAASAAPTYASSALAQVDELAAAGASSSARLAQAEASVLQLTRAFDDNVAVCVRMVDGDAGFDVNGSESFQSASMIKLAVLAEYLDETASGELSPADTYTLAREDVVGGSGSMQDDPLGTTYTLDEVAQRMISQSDNVGTNVLIERMGVESVDDKAAELGLEETSLAHKLMIAANDGRFNLTSADDCASILLSVAHHELASEARSIDAEGWLLAQEDDEGIAQGLPDGVAFGHKTGTVDGIRHDGGIVYAQDPYVICVFTRGLDYDAANALMAQVSAAVYDALE